MMWKTGAQWSIDIIERDLSLDVIEEKERRAPDDDGSGAANVGLINKLSYP